MLNSHADVNLNETNVLSLEMSATVLKLHDRFHQNDASKCVIASESFQTVDDEINTNQYQNQNQTTSVSLPTNEYRQGLLAATRANRNSSQSNATIGSGDRGDVNQTTTDEENLDGFDFTLTPLDKPNVV